ncbi:MAG: alpha/beta fold hydrolase [Steroidobacteraceae bacterium]
MAKPEITRHFATITDGRWGARQVHYRRCGSGPAVIMLHQSPLSSLDMIHTMRRWHKHFTCIAPDTPGFGLSDPLGVAAAETVDFAEAVTEFMDALGIGRAAIYGFHTGAMIAGAMALAFPQRVTAAAANGYVVLDENERADLVANYLPPFRPEWDGSHLTWSWARMREQTIFFPWYAKSQAERLPNSVPDPQTLQAALLDLLRAGDHYRVGYRAAFTMRGELATRHATVPLLVTAAKTDVLATQLPRLRNCSRTTSVIAGGSVDETLDLVRDFLKRGKPAAAPAVAATAGIAGRAWNDTVRIPGGQLRLRRNLDAPGRPVVVQHDAAGSSDIIRPLAESFIGHRPVIAIDLPGHGESDNTLGSGRVTVAGHARAVQQALRALGVDQYDFVGTWGGALVGLELATTARSALRRLVLADLMYFDAPTLARLRKHYTPRIEPDWYGGHLLHTWHMIRDQSLFWPWFDRSSQGVIHQPVNVATEMVHRRVIEVFKAPEMWRAAYQAHFAYPVKARLRALKVPAMLVAPDWDPNLAHTRNAHRDFPHIPFRRMPASWRDWGRELIAFLDA